MMMHNFRLVRVSKSKNYTISALFIFFWMINQTSKGVSIHTHCQSGTVTVFVTIAKFHFVGVDYIHLRDSFLNTILDERERVITAHLTI